MQLASEISSDGVRRAGRSLRGRRLFTAVTFLVAILLLAWGAFVTSINAGLAVPDWPTSFRSYDPFNPWPEWWRVTPVLAEHGHRLLGALVGMLTVVLAVWTWIRDDRRWMRLLGAGAVVLVTLQGLLGGLRVVWVSLDLAVVHACVAQLFFALLASMVLFVSPSWSRVADAPAAPVADRRRIRRAALLTPVAVYIQIILGALLRHPGTGIDPLLAGLHLGWAFLAIAAIMNYWTTVRTVWSDVARVGTLAHVMLGVMTLQVLLGLLAYFVLLDESGMIQPSNVQVIINSAHMVVGALLFASVVATSVLVFRRLHLTRPANG